MNGPEELHGACAPSAGPPGTSDGDCEERWATSREFRSAWPRPPGGLGSLDTCRAADPALRRFLSHRRTALGRARRRDLSRSHSDLTENRERLDGSTGRPPGSDAGGVLRVGGRRCCGDTERARAEPRRKDVSVPENVRRGALWGRRLRPFLMRTTMLTCAIFLKNMKIEERNRWAT